MLHISFAATYALLALVLSYPTVNAFTVTLTTTTAKSAFPNPAKLPTYKSGKSRLVLLYALPTIEQLTKDPFMKQVQYGSELTSAMLKDDSEKNDKNAEASSSSSSSSASLAELLQAQLSHSEGIRGFMVSYLTAERTPADDEIVPSVLFRALQKQAAKDPDDLIPLTCMNVIMPIAMTTMHQDAELAANSAKTGERGIRILKALAEDGNAMVQENAKAILTVAKMDDDVSDDVVSTDSDDNNDPKLVKYWIDFFEKWGYKAMQKKDIAKAMNEILTE